VGLSLQLMRSSLDAQTGLPLFLAFYPFAGRASYILASLYLRRNYGSIFRSAQSLQLRTARRLVKDLTRSISAALRWIAWPAKG
jgi:hypothetical protein